MPVKTITLILKTLINREFRLISKTICQGMGK
jgi:hypothetical protein